MAQAEELQRKFDGEVKRLRDHHASEFTRHKQEIERMTKGFEAEREGWEREREEHLNTISDKVREAVEAIETRLRHEMGDSIKGNEEAMRSIIELDRIEAEKVS